MKREHYKFLIADELIIAAVVNFFLNAGIAWFLTRRETMVPARSVAGDTLGTAFILPVITALVAGPLVRFQVARGKLPHLPPERLGAWSRRSSLVRGIVLGALMLLVVALPALHFSMAMPAAHFVWAKGAIAAGFGMVVTPLLGWWALQAASRTT